MRRFAKPLYGLTPVPRVRIPPSPPRSLNCGETLSAAAKIRERCPYFALLLGKPDRRERTAEDTKALTSPLFSATLIRSPTSQGLSGEHRAITNRMPCETLRDFREARFSLPIG